MEFVGQMGLIAIARRQGQLCPIQGSVYSNHLQRVLKALQPAIELRRESDLLPEKLGKMTAAQASPMGQFLYSRDLGPARKLLQGITYCGI